MENGKCSSLEGNGKNKDSCNDFKERVRIASKNISLYNFHYKELSFYTNMIPHKKWVSDFERKLSKLCSVYLACSNIVILNPRLPIFKSPMFKSGMGEAAYSVVRSIYMSHASGKTRLYGSDLL